MKVLARLDCPKIHILSWEVAQVTLNWNDDCVCYLLLLFAFGVYELRERVESVT